MPQPIWTPNQKNLPRTAMHKFMVRAQEAVPAADIADYNGLHRWSVRDPDAFWTLFLEFCDVRHGGSVTPPRAGERMPNAAYFPSVTLNFAENLLRFDGEETALLTVSEAHPSRRTSRTELRSKVAQCAAGLRAAGVQVGDRVAGFLPNIEEAVVAMLAAASMGAVWSSCSPDFGAQGVIDRFGQIKPKVLIAANAYVYNGRIFDCVEKVQGICAAIPAIETLVLIKHVDRHTASLTGSAAEKSVTWQAFNNRAGAKLSFAALPFNHPLYIMYSSGTTGLPKSIVHGAGGTLLQHAKEHLLHCDLRPGDNMLYFTTCGWMMWNWLVSSLFVGSTVTLFDGSPSHPSMDALWKVAAEENVTHFGCSPKFLASCRDRSHPGRNFDLSKLRVVLSTGAPLAVDDFRWVYSEVKADVQLSSISGGTDIISCFMLGNPLLPVHEGEIQCLGLGMDVAAYDADDQAITRSKGELVCRTPFPSAPISFWGDEAGERYHSSYFKRGDGVWFHGDYIELTESQGEVGGITVYGRSDTTLNPGGVRIGTAEIYRIVDTLPEVTDSIVVGQPWEGDVRVVLFVTLREEQTWNTDLESKIKRAIRAGATPRHVPALVRPVGAVPYTISGKKVELAVLDMLGGRVPANLSALANPDSLDAFRTILGPGE